MSTRTLPLFSLVLTAIVACGDDASLGSDTDTEGTTSMGMEGSTSGDTVDSTADEGSTGEVQDPGCMPVGFGPMQTYALPPGLGTFDSIPKGGSCSEGLDRYAVRDMTGDGRLDLVITYECDLAEPADSWIVHPGTASAFSPQAQEWALPDPHGDPGRYYGMGCDGCDHEVRDVDGDGLPDMLVAYVQSQLGDGYWWLHRGTGTGFEYDGTRYQTPSGMMQFWSTAEDECFVPPPTQSDEWFPEFFLHDLDGDERPDMVLDPSCDDVMTLAEPVLHVFPSGPSGFADTPTEWALPTPVSVDCDSPLSNQLFDIDGDGLPEYVEFASCWDYYDCETSHWLVYDAQDGGYTAQPRTYDVPSHVG